MSDYSRTQELVAAAYDSEGSAEGQFEKTLDSLEAKLTELKNAWDAFTMGLANSDIIKGVVDVLTFLLNLLNKVTDFFGKGTSSVLKLVAAFAAFAGLAKTLPKLVGKISEVFVTALGKGGEKSGNSFADRTIASIQQRLADFFGVGEQIGKAVNDGMESAEQGDTKKRQPKGEKTKKEGAQKEKEKTKTEEPKVKSEDEKKLDEWEKLGKMELNDSASLADYQRFNELDNEIWEKIKNSSVNQDLVIKYDNAALGEEGAIKAAMVENYRKSLQNQKPPEEQGAPKAKAAGLSTNTVSKVAKGVAIGGAAVSAALNMVRTSLEESGKEINNTTEGFLQLGEGLATTATTAGTVASTLISLGGNFASLAGPVGIAIAAIGALIAIFKAVDEWYEDGAEKAERLNKEYEEQKALVEEVTSAYDAYVTANEELKDLIKGTEEYSEKLAECTERALALQAASGGEIKLYLDENGNWQVDEESYSTYIKKQADKEKEDQIAANVANVEAKLNPKEDWWSLYAITETESKKTLSTKDLTGAQLQAANIYNDLIKGVNDVYKTYRNSEKSAEYLRNQGYTQNEGEGSKEFVERIIAESYQAVVDAGGAEQYAKYILAESEQLKVFARNPLDLTSEEVDAAKQLEESDISQYLIDRGMDEADAEKMAKTVYTNFNTAINSALEKAGFDSNDTLTETQKVMTLDQLIGQTEQKEVLARSKDQGATLQSQYDSLLSMAQDALSPEQFQNFVDYLNGIDLTDLTELEGLATIFEDFGVEVEGGEDAINGFITAVRNAGIAIRSSFDASQYEEYILANRLTVQDKVENRERSWTEDEYSSLAQALKIAGKGDFLDKFTQNKEGEYIYLGDFSELEKITSGTEGNIYDYAKESLTWKSKAETDAKAAAADITPAVAKAMTAVEEAQKEYDVAKGTANKDAAFGKLASAQTQLDRAQGFMNAGKDKTFLDTYATQQDFKTATALNAGQEGYIDNDTLKGYMTHLFGGLEPSQFEDLTGITPEALSEANLDDTARQKLFDLIADYVYQTNNNDQLTQLQEQGAFSDLNQTSTQVLNDQTLSGDEKSDRLEGFIKETEGAAEAFDYFKEKGAAADNTTKALAVSSTKAAKRFSEFGDSIESNIDALKNSKKGTVEYNKALAAISESAKSAFGEDINMDVVLSDMERLEKIAEGDTDAFKSLQNDIYDSSDFIQKTLSDIDVNANDLFGRDWSMEPTMDIGGWSGSADEILKKAQNATAALAQLGFTSEYIYDDKGAITGVRVTGSASSGLGSRSSGGGGGGGGGKDKNWENPYDPLYNLTEKINEALREREKLERAYDRLLEDRNGNFADIIQNTLDTMANLENEISLQTRLQEGRREQLENIGSETYTDDDGNEKTFAELDVLKYGSYNFDTQTISIDWAAIDAIKDADKGAAVEAYISRLEELQEQYEDTQETLEDMEDELEEIRQRGKEEYLGFEQRVYDALVAAQQELIDNYSDLAEELNDTNSKILEDLQRSIELQRQIRDNTETEEDISDKEARLAYLQRDSSGANAVEILKLQQELEDARQDYQDTLIDQEIDRLSEQNDLANEQRERQIEIMQSQLDWAEKSGAFWEQVNTLISKAINPDGTLDNNSALVALLKDTDAFKGMSDFGQMNWIAELVQNFHEAEQGYSNWMVEKASVEGNTIAANDKNGKSVGELTYKDGKWVDSKGNDYSVQYNASSKSFVAEKNQKEPAVTVPTSTKTETKKASSGGGGSPSQTSQGVPKNNDIEQVALGDDGELIKGNKTGAKYQKTVTGYKLAYKSGVSDPWYIKTDTKTLIAPTKELLLKKEEEFWQEYKKNINDLTAEAYKRNQALKKENPSYGGGIKSGIVANYKYATGGLNTQTGPAWLDGTPSKPEYVLNATQTEAFLKLTKVLPDLLSGAKTNAVGANTTYYDVNFVVDSIASDYDVDKLWERFKQKIYEDGAYRNTTVINRLR